jgi:hypothetical protein
MGCSSNSVSNTSVLRLGELNLRCQKIMHMNRFTIDYGPAVHRMAINRDFRRYRSRNGSKVSDPPEHVIFDETNDGVIRVAYLRCGLSNRV